MYPVSLSNRVRMPLDTEDDITDRYARRIAMAAADSARHEYERGLVAPGEPTPAEERRLLCGLIEIDIRGLQSGCLTPSGRAAALDRIERHARAITASLGHPEPANDTHPTMRAAA